MSSRRRSKKKQEETLVDLVEARESAQDFFERNQKIILGVVGAIVVIAGGIFAYNNFYKAPRQQRAMEAMYQAQVQFERDSFALALENPGGGNEGFLDVIDNYGGTSAANVAQFYAGLSWLHLGQYEAALEHLKKFSPSGEVTPMMKFGAMGDAYSELGDMDKASKNYKKAIKAGDNDFVTAYYLKKLGMLYETQGNAEDARRQYEMIKDQYSDTPSGRDIQKYLARVGGNG
jgi:tetratricopeptide (TPR) repeat protein